MYKAGEEMGKELRKLPPKLRVLAVVISIVMMIVVVSLVGATIHYFGGDIPKRVESSDVQKLGNRPLIERCCGPW